MERTILTNGYLDANDLVTPIEPSCTTADCFWPLYGSVGICSDFADVSDTKNPVLAGLLLDYANKTITGLNNASLPGYPLGPSYVAVTADAPVPSFVFSAELTAAAVGDVLFLYTPNPVLASTMTPQDMRYAEVIFYACTKSFETVVTSGVKTTKEKDSVSEMVSGVTNSTFFNSLWSPDKLELQPQFSCKPEVGNLSIEMKKPQGVSDKYEFNLCTALMMSSVLNQYMPGWIVMRAEDRQYDMTVGMLASALGTTLFGGFMGEVPSPDVQSQNLKGMARNIAAGLTNM